MYNKNRTNVSHPFKVFFIQGGFLMTGWTLFFIIIGVAVLTAQLFRIIDAIERPSRRMSRGTPRQDSFPWISWKS